LAPDPADHFERFLPEALKVGEIKIKIKNVLGNSSRRQSLIGDQSGNIRQSGSFIGGKFTLFPFANAIKEIF
jgi:hypothetical protein